LPDGPTAQLRIMLASFVTAAIAFSINGAPRAPHVGLRSSPLAMQVAAPAPVKDGSALASVTLKNAAGDTVTAYKFGACVSSYVKDGTDVLMVRPDAKMDGSKPISGGIPLCFPQFGPGAIQQHGFARNLDWEVAEQSDSSVVFRLTENEYTLSMWPYKFEALYKVSLDADKLSLEMCVTNTGDKAFDFTAALHSYWSVSSIDNVKISSPAFAGATYLDKMQSPPKDVQSATADIKITAETDSVYADVSGDVVLADSGRKKPMTISSSVGWSDTVLWNPYGDEGMGFDGFVCIESAQASSPVVLQPSEYWVGLTDVMP